jgi:hypothetical protein
MKKSKINEIEDLSCFGRFYDFVIKFLRNDLTPLQLEAIIEMYQILKQQDNDQKQKENDQIRFLWNVEPIENKPNEAKIVVDCCGNLKPIHHLKKLHLAHVFMEMGACLFNAIDNYNMDLEEAEIVKKMNGMRTAPLEKINEGASPKTQFNENEIL